MPWCPAKLVDATSRGLVSEQFYATASYKSRDLRGIGLGRNDLQGWNLAACDLTLADLQDANLTLANLERANLSQANLQGTHFRSANVRDVVFDNASIRGSSFRDTVTRGLTQPQLLTSRDYQVDNQLPDIDLGENDLRGWDFTGLKLPGIVFDAADLSGVSLQAVTATGASFKGTVLQGADDDLWGWNFSGQNLEGADFSQASLSGADLTGARIAGAAFHEDPWFAGQLYRTASYRLEELPGVKFLNMNLRGWNLTHQNLAGADFTADSADEQLTGTDFRGADLRGALGLRDSELARAFTDNMIRPDGTIEGLNLQRKTGWSSEITSCRSRCGIVLKWQRTPTLSSAFATPCGTHPCPSSRT